MQWITGLLSDLNASQLAVLLLSMQCAVIAMAWGFAAWRLPSERRAALWCGQHAAALSLGLLLMVWGLHTGTTLLRALGHVVAMYSVVTLQRGLWVFTNQAPQRRAQAALMWAVLGLSVLAEAVGTDRMEAWRIGALSALAAGACLWMARDAWRLQHIQPRWAGLGLLCATPLLLAALLMGLRALRALLAPELVMAEVARDSWLSLGTAVLGMVAVLVLQLALLGLLALRLWAQVEQLSRHDALTGLLNRRAIDQLMQAEAQRVRRLGGQWSVLMVDLDHFKRINDTLGHAVGDQALRHLAGLMAGNLRQVDRVARWGGEEFLAMLPGTGGEEAMRLAERMRERVRAEPLVVAGRPLQLTASVGVAHWRGSDDQLDALVARADAAMYRAKHDGRDCVRRHDGHGLPPASGAVAQAAA